MTYVKLGNVRAFPDVRPDKAQALKVLEGASEVHGALKALEKAHMAITGEAPNEQSDVKFGHRMARECAEANLVGKLADTIQACANLAAALGVEDLTPYMAECEERNRERGRYEDL